MSTESRRRRKGEERREEAEREKKGRDERRVRMGVEAADQARYTQL
jgi:hypothetical protein